MLKLTLNKMHNRTRPSSETWQITTLCHHGWEEEVAIEVDRTEEAEVATTGVTAEANGANNNNHKMSTRVSLVKVPELTVRVLKHLARTKELNRNRCSKPWWKESLRASAVVEAATELGESRKLKLYQCHRKFYVERQVKSSSSTSRSEMTYSGLGNKVLP